MSLSKLYQEITAFYPGTELVFGDGDAKASLLLIGKRRAGTRWNKNRSWARQEKNLNEFLDVLGLRREQIYITNVCKFRPLR